MCSRYLFVTLKVLLIFNLLAARFGWGQNEQLSRFEQLYLASSNWQLGY